MEFYNYYNFNSQIGHDKNISILQEKVSCYKVLKISPPSHYKIQKNFHESLAKSFGYFGLDKEDGRTNTLKKGKWMEVVYDPLVQDAYRHSKNHQPLHTDFSYFDDFPDYTFMYCQTSATKGGETVFIDSLDLVSALSGTVLLQKLLSTNIVFKKSFKNRTKTRSTKVIQEMNGDMVVNWNYYCVDADQKKEAILLAEDFHRFLEEEVMFSNHVTPVLLKEGDSVIWHDSLVLHGRNSFEAKNLGDRSLYKTHIYKENHHA